MAQNKQGAKGPVLKEVTPEQKALGHKFNEQMQAQQEHQKKQQETFKKNEAEIKKLLDYLIDNGLKMRKSLLYERKQGKEFTMQQEYFLASEFNFLVLKNAEEVLKICKNIDETVGLNGLKKMQDSVKLGYLCIHHGRVLRLFPHPHYYPDPKAKTAAKPKQVIVGPQNYQAFDAVGIYMIKIQKSETSGKSALWLVFFVALAFFFLLFRVWPEWLRLGVWYFSWYLLCLLVGIAVVRVILWFALFHLGIDFWLFPNYFIDSDNILDSFMPFLEFGKREDMFDVRMFVLRIASVGAIYYSVNEFVREPANVEELLSGSNEVYSELFNWGQNKFLGVADNSTGVQTKKSARQIYAEAFMEEENPMFRSNTQFNKYAFSEEELAEQEEAAKNEKQMADMEAENDEEEAAREQAEIEQEARDLEAEIERLTSKGEKDTKQAEL